jgi:hypothetical protein
VSTAGNSLQQCENSQQLQGSMAIGAAVCHPKQAQGENGCARLRREQHMPTAKEQHVLLKLL